MGAAKTAFQFISARKTGEADVTIVPVYQKAEPVANASKKTASGKTKTAKTNSADKVLWGEEFQKTALQELCEWANEEQFNGSRSSLLKIRTTATGKLPYSSRWVLLSGLGETTSFLPKHWAASLSKALAKALTFNGLKMVQINLPEGSDTLSADIALTLLVDTVYQCTYQSMESKTPEKKALPTILIALAGGVAPSGSVLTQLDKTLEKAIALAEARTLVQDLVNHPSNLKSTNTLLECAKTVSRAATVSLAVKDSVSWIEKNMPCFFEVARGSVDSDPPRFIHLHYKPKADKKSSLPKKQIALVGKSVIFDTGGYQVKPGNYMNTMKGDMTGGAVVLAAIQGVASLGLQNIEVHAYLAATPNKINSQAMIPDSIVNTTCGKKVEIRHTDAEGRLTLIDAVSKAAETNPDEMISIATLTGSASMAVGRAIALMANNSSLRDRIEQAGRKLQEPIQTLDIVDEDFEDIKSLLDGADIRNTSKQKNRGAQSAAAFVMSGIKETLPMAHLDIAGADMTSDEKATGISAHTILQYLLDEDERLGSQEKSSRISPSRTSSARVSSATEKAGKPLPKSASISSKPATKRKPASNS
jgi:leucyl aminopeptidase